MEAIILAGGLGTRLKSVVATVPKPLAPIRTRPFLEYLLDYLIAQGVNEVILSVGYGGESISRHFESRYRELTIRYSWEAQPLGTGGALRLALRAAQSDPVFVLNGDSLAEISYVQMAKAHERSGALLTMATKRVDDASRYGTVVVDDGVVSAFESQGAVSCGFINCGVYLVTPSLLDWPELPSQFSFEKDFLTPQISHIRPHAFLFEGYFIDIGIPEDYQRAQIDLPDWRQAR